MKELPDIENSYPLYSGLEETLGYRRTVWTPDLAQTELIIDHRHKNLSGRVHGGIYAMLIDDAAGFLLCWSSNTVRDKPGLTLNLTTEYIGAPSTDHLIATATRKGGGRSIAFAAVEVKDSAGVLLATGSATYKLKKPD